MQVVIIITNMQYYYLTIFVCKLLIGIEIPHNGHLLYIEYNQLCIK